jgi:hypothetical protein
MPSYKNFRNDFLRSTEPKNIFINPKIRTIEEMSAEREENIIEWTTFYRRNIEIFVEHYFEIKLFPYQKMWLYLMGVYDSFVAIAARGTGKSWLVGVLACAKAVLYPDSKVVVVSSTKSQAGTIIEKIADLRNNHPNLKREISNLITNTNKWEVTFHNGSSIVVVASRDSSRGHRSTFTIYEEFPLIDKDIIDSVIRPFSYVRQTPYLKNTKYEHLKEEPKEVWISSANHKGLWWFEETKKNILAMLNGDSSFFIALDYLLTIKHGIKTKRQIKNEMSKMDEVSILEEYFNIPWGEASNAYFKLKMFDRVRKIKRPFYPQLNENYNSKRNPYDIPRLDGELRILSCDFAQRAGKTNDLSVISCIRLFPTHKGYYRELSYMETSSGENSILQALRVKQIWKDFGADYIVIDIATSGISVFDSLGQVTTDNARGIEYPAMTVYPHFSLKDNVIEELTNRTLGINAIPIIYPISATPELNSKIAVDMRDKLQKKMWNFLCDSITAEDYLIDSEFSEDFLENNAFFLHPFVETGFFIGECVNLSMDVKNSYYKLTEPSGGRKDRYSSVSYGNYFISFFDQDLIRENDDEDGFDEILKLIQTT